MNNIVYTASFTQHLVVIACMAKQHNASSTIAGHYYFDVEFENEDDFYSFMSDAKAYFNQQEYLESLSEEEMFQLGLIDTTIQGCEEEDDDVWGQRLIDEYEDRQCSSL